MIRGACFEILVCAPPCLCRHAAVYALDGKPATYFQPGTPWAQEKALMHSDTTSLCVDDNVIVITHEWREKVFNDIIVIDYIDGHHAKGATMHR